MARDQGPLPKKPELDVILLTGTDLAHGRGDSTHLIHLHRNLSDLAPTTLVHRGAFGLVGGPIESGGEFGSLGNILRTAAYHLVLCLWLAIHPTKSSVVYCHDWSVALVASFMRHIRRFKVVYELNGLVSSQMPLVSDKGLTDFFSKLQLLAIKKADGVTAVTDRLADTVRSSEGFEHLSITVITNAGDAGPPPISKAAARQKLALPLSTKIVGFVGSLTRWQGVDLLLQSFRIVASQCPDCELIVVGEGSERQSLEEETRRLGLPSLVRFTGHVDHQTALMYIGAFDVGVVPYRYKNLYEKIGRSPIKAYEYMAGERPFVCGAFPGLREEVVRAGCGLVVQPDDKSALAGALLTVLQNPEQARQMGEAGRIYVSREKSWRTVASRVMNKCLEVMGKLDDPRETDIAGFPIQRRT